MIERKGHLKAIHAYLMLLKIGTCIVDQRSSRWYLLRNSSVTRMISCIEERSATRYSTAWLPVCERIEAATSAHFADCAQCTTVAPMRASSRCHFANACGRTRHKRNLASQICSHFKAPLHNTLCCRCQSLTPSAPPASQQIEQQHKNQICSAIANCTP